MVTLEIILWKEGAGTGTIARINKSQLFSISKFLIKVQIPGRKFLTDPFWVMWLLLT